ncbi:MAG: type III secretion system chaperone [Puniceicoccales bacterium]|jgi:hypothetical protein|nr:type III secretion system chaperone [Puniceicoccales bacterium]
MENCLDTFRTYVQILGDKLKIEGLDLDESNDCYLAFDGKYFVKCSIDIEKEQLCFLAYIGALPADEAVFYRGILESCHFWRDTAGANVSLDPSDGTLLLTQYCDMNMLDNDIFYNILEKFVSAMEHWDTKRFEEWMAMTDSEAEGSAIAADGGIGMPGMMMFGA